MKHNRGIEIAGSIVGLLVVGYIATSLTLQHNQKFLMNTQIAGVDVSGKTADQVTNQVSHALEHRTYHVVEHGQAIYSFNSKSAGIKINTKHDLQKLVTHQNYWGWPLALMNSASANENVSLGKLNVSDTSMHQLLTQIMKNADQKKRTPTKNAKLIYQNKQVEIQKEVQGTKINPSTLKSVVKKALAAGQTSINLKAAYVKPTVTSTSKALMTAKTKAQPYAKEVAKYNINGHKFQIPNNTILGWVQVDHAGKVTLNQKSVLAYVNKLNDKYHTYHTTRTFKSTLRGKVKINGGFYGWSIKTKKEAAALSKQVLAGKDFTRSPLINGSGYHNRKTDIGDTYIEVDKQHQHMWVYVNGKVKVSTDVVTGKPGKHATTTGIWDVWSKQRNSTLKGQNDNGSNYSQPVAYWMPFDDTGEGIHDSPWQPQYGGTWYQSHGSHGCVNTPPAVVGKVYDAIKVGTPVVVF